MIAFQLKEMSARFPWRLFCNQTNKSNRRLYADVQTRCANLKNKQTKKIGKVSNRLY